MIRTPRLTARRLALVAIAAALTPVVIVAGVAPVAASQEAAVTVLHKGVWTKKSFNAAGEWTIIEDGGALYVTLSDDFKTQSAPDLKIFLSPLAAAQTNGRNATDGSVLVAELTSAKGGQRYAIPAGTDLSKFQSILIHCEQYAKLWSAADLR